MPREASFRPKEIALIVLGAILGLTGLLAAFAGGAVLAAMGPPNTIQSGTHRVGTSANAVVSPAASIEGEARFASIFGTPTVRVDVTTVARGGVFVGIAPAAKVDRYLAGASVAVVNDLNVGAHDHSTSTGGKTPASPDDQSFWVAHATGATGADLTWTPLDGTYRIVVMRADARPGIDLQGRVGLTIPDLGGIATGLVIGGSIALFLGIGTLALALRTRTRRTGRTAGSRPTRSSPAVGTRVS